jgi:hypothetical protein
MTPSFTMMPPPHQAATSAFAFAFARARLSAVPSHIEKAESTVSSITNSSKNSSDEFSEKSFSPAKKANNDRKRKTDERPTGFPRHTRVIASRAACLVGNVSSLVSWRERGAKIE